MIPSHERQRRVYSSGAARYERLIAAEDCDDNLPPALASIVSPAGKTIVDVGSGTGRLARLWIDAGANVVAFDREPAMIRVARRRAHTRSDHPVGPFVADARSIPLGSAKFDVVSAGWVFGHFPYWNPDGWEADAETALAETTRVLRSGGTVVLFETLGTAVEAPAAPSPTLAAYYAWLEEVHGFEKKVLRTDYEFSSVAEATALCGFFFGEELGRRVRARSRRRVPEFTGMWWRRVEGA